MKCPKCGSGNPTGTKSCSDCGYDLTVAGIASSIDYSRPQSYTPRSLADQILASRHTMEGERKQVTVLFTDVSGFTSISEKMDPEQVHDLIGECLAFLIEEIHRYEGTVVQFLGDGLMALFGAPLVHEDDPQRALHAALKIQERMKEYALKLKKRNIEFKLRLGLNTGLVIVGKIGDDLAMEYTAIGDTVNLASRMLSLAQPGTILVSESTHRLTEGYFDFKDLGEVEVKGKKQPVKAYELLRLGPSRTRLGVAEARGLTPFVGRKKELGDLLDCLHQVEKGLGQVVGVVGEAGVGKSRLLLQMRETLLQGNYSYIEGSCFHYGEAVPYLPVLNILRHYFGIKEGESEPDAKRKMKDKITALDPRLATSLPPLYDLFSFKVEDDAYVRMDARRKRERTFEALKNLLFRHSQNQPLVMAVEDVHWVDKTSEEFLGQFIASLARTHILLILLYRPEYTNPWASKTYYTQIRLDQFPEETGAQMVQEMLQEGNAAPDVKRLILSKAAGNPLFVEEFTRALLDRGWIRRTNGDYVLDTKPVDIQLPETIQGIIGARIDRLDSNTRHILQVASVIGRDFSLRILEVVMGGSVGLKSHLIDLQFGDFIYQSLSLPESEYTFRHSLIQEVAYSTLLLRKRKAIHRATGEAIEQFYQNRLEEVYEVLAYHYSAADELDRAFRYLRLSAEKAKASYSTIEGFGYYREGFGILRRQADTEDNRRAKVDTALAMYPVLVALNYPEGSRVILEEARKAADQLGDRSAWVRLTADVGMLLSMRGEFLAGVRMTQEAFDEAHRLADETTVLWSALTLCGNYLHWGEAVKGADVAERAVALMERADIESRQAAPEFKQYVTLLYYLGWAKGMLGDFDEAERLCDKAIRLASEIKNRFVMAGAHLFRAIVATYRGRPDAVLYHGREAARLSEQIQVPYVLGPSWMIMSWGYYYQGDWPTAREWAEKSISLMTQHQLWPPVAAAHIASGLASRELGDLPAAQRSIETALKVARENRQRGWEAQALTELGRLLAAMDPQRTAEAERLILEGISIADSAMIKSVEALGHWCLGETYLIGGAKEAARLNLDKARQMCQEMGMSYYLGRTQEALQTLEPRRPS